MNLGFCFSERNIKNPITLSMGFFYSFILDCHTPSHCARNDKAALATVTETVNLKL